MIGIPLKYVIEQQLAEEQRDGRHKWLSYLAIAVSGLSELHFDISGQPVFTELTANNQGVLELPADCAKVVRLTIVAADGTLVALGRDANIYKTKDDCGNVSGNNNPSLSAATLGDVFWTNTYSDHFQNGQFIGAWFGAGGQSIAGNFNVDYDRGIINLGIGASNIKYVLEYITNAPRRINGQFLVHPFLVEPLLAWIRYAKKRNFAGIGEVKALEADYVAKKHWAAQRFWNMDFEEILEITRKHFTQSPNF